MYKNPYNENIVSELKKINERYLEHIKEEVMTPYISGFDGNGKYGGRTHNDSGFEEVKTIEGNGKLEGEGIVDTIKDIAKRGKYTLKSLGKIFLTKDSDFGDLANVISLGKYGLKTGGKRGRPKKDKEDKKEGAGLGKLGQIRWSNLLKGGRALKEETKLEKGKRGRPKKIGGNISSVVESKGQSFLSPQEKLDRIEKEGGAKAKEDEKMAMEIKGLKDKVEGGKKRGRPKKEGGAKAKEDEKMAMEIKGLKDKVEGGKKKEAKSVINDIVKSLKKSGSGANPRKIGGRKLLSLSEMPPSQMSGNGMSEGVKEYKKSGSGVTGGKKENPWLTLVKKVRKEHPELKGVKAISEFIKKNNLYKK
jgi:hypothetical protein